MGFIGVCFGLLQETTGMDPLIDSKRVTSGTAIGILPGIGATAAVMVSCNKAVRTSKHPEMFGISIPEDITAPETVNNANLTSQERHHKGSKAYMHL